MVIGIGGWGGGGEVGGGGLTSVLSGCDTIGHIFKHGIGGRSDIITCKAHAELH